MTGMIVQPIYPQFPGTAPEVAFFDPKEALNLVFIGIESRLSMTTENSEKSYQANIHHSRRIFG
jgi:hypothetical protein